MCLQGRIQNNLKSIADNMNRLETMIQGATSTLKNVKSIDNISGMYREKIVDLVAIISSNLIKLELDIACVELKADNKEKLEAGIILSETSQKVHAKTITIKEKVERELKVDVEEVSNSIEYLECHLMRLMDNSYSLLVKSVSNIDKCMVRKHEGIKNLRVADSEYLYSVYSYGISINNAILELENSIDEEKEFKAKRLILTYLAKNFKVLLDRTLTEFNGRVEIFENEMKKLREMKDSIKILDKVAV